MIWSKLPLDGPIIITRFDPEIVDLESIPLSKFEASPTAGWLWAPKEELEETVAQVA